MARLHRALCANHKGTGVVLYVDSHDLEDLLDDCSWELRDVGLDHAPEGLSVWTGHIRAVYTGHGMESDFDLEGEFRSLGSEEWVELENGRTPWSKKPRK